MFDKIIAYSVKNKFVIGLLVAALAVWGLYSLKHLPIDAVPDITNNQVQIITVSPSLATQEVEQFITTPIELSLQNIQQLKEIRSVSRFGLSVVTVVFEESLDLYLARQLVGEQIKLAEENIPPGLGKPEMSPISTGLGEIYQYVVYPEKEYEDVYSLTDLRTIQDWIVRRQLSGVKGVVEVNTLGGYLKQYEVAVEPEYLKAVGISIADIYHALQNSNENAGGAYIEKNPNTYYIRTNGIAKSLEDIGNIVITNRNGNPVLIKDVASVQFGKAPRQGALTRDGREAIGGTVMMLKGANSKAVIQRVKERMDQIQKSLPEGIIIEAFLDRDKLISTAIGTVKTNLIEGGLIVVFILVLMLGNWRAGLIVASVIPLAMLFAVAMMRQFGISANLMSLGAIDFGLIVDGAVIIVESIVHRLQINHGGRLLSKKQMDNEVIHSSQKIRNSAAFGEIIILMVYIPILALVGIEGKMFKPMAQTVMLAITGALILSLTYVPMMSALFLKKSISTKKTVADRIINFCQGIYNPVLNRAMRYKRTFVGLTVLILGISIFTFTKMGGEFIPTLEEGDLALHQILPPGSSLSQSVEISKMIQDKLMSEFPEVEDVVTKIGSAEIPTDPMPIETGDIIVILKPKAEWTSASSRQELFEKMEKSLQVIPGMNYTFSQPIQMRFNELMTGSRADVAIKLYGDNLDLIYEKAKEAETLIKMIDGVGTVKVDQTVGMPQFVINYKYAKMAQYGLRIKDVNQMVKTAFAGEKAGTIYEDDKTFDLVVRLKEDYRKNLRSVEDLYVTLHNGTQVPLTEVATVDFEETPMQITRDNTKRRIVIGVDVGNTDVASLVKRIQTTLNNDLELPAGYYFTYGGQFENLKAANARLSIVVPIALALIFTLLFFTFGSISQAVLIFTAIPFSAIGGIWALQLRGLPFSISAGIGFIALFGVAVLNGIVLIGYFNELKKEGVMDLKERIRKGTNVRLRPVLLTAAVASLGFLPMALSNSGGAEVQRPLATVVIGGLLTATFLTLIILPIFYYWLERWNENRKMPFSKKPLVSIVLLLIGMNVTMQAQNQEISLDDAIEIALENHPNLIAADLLIEKNESLQNLKYNLGTTRLKYKGDGFFKENPEKVNQIGLVQKFPNPALTKANNNFQKEVWSQSVLGKKQIVNQLKLNVSITYLDLQYQKELLLLLDSLNLVYQQFYDIAKIRADVGETNNIEPLTILSKHNENELLIRQSKIEINGLEQTLQYLLNTSQPITSKHKLYPMVFEESVLSNSIQLQQVEQKVAIETAKTDLLKAQLKPNFDIGYSAQHYVELGWLNGIEAGIQIPLFNGQAKQKIAAQKIDIEISNQHLESYRLEDKQQRIEARKKINIYQEGLQAYQNQLESNMPELVRVTQLNYQAGEISYLQYLNTLQLLSSNNKKYLEQLLAFNQAVVYYNYLSNN